MNAKRKRKSPTLKAEIFNQLIAEEGNHRKEAENTENDEVNNKSLKLLLNEMEGTAAESDITLNTITDYYHKRLYDNDNAVEYLKSKGIINPELHNRFQVGFNDGSIKERLSKKQMTNLHQTFSLREDLNKLYEGCLVFPLFDENEQVINICFLNISDDSEQYLYPDRPGIFNHLASKTYPDQLILTESILDALSLLQIECSNVQSLMKNATAFTESHIQHLKDNNVRNTVIAFKSNEFSTEACRILKELLLFNQIDVKTIYPPNPHHSWMTAVNNGLIKDELVKQINEASLISHDKKEDDFTVRDEGIHTVFIINGITYRIAGLKDVFVSNLKVKISAEMGDEYFPDTVDLCSSRSRMSYSNILAGRFNVEPRRIENDLIRILRYQEDKRDNVLNPKKEKQETFSEKEKQEAVEFLKSPDLINQTLIDLTAIGCAGEDSNKLLAYVTGLSRYQDKPLSLYVLSSPGTGKSHLVETVIQLFPDHSLKLTSSLSDQAFPYMPEEDFEEKIFVMGEDHHSTIVEGYIRQMQSENRITRDVVKKDNQTGEMNTVHKTHKVRIVFMTTSTKLDVNIENISRCILIKVDESKDQTENVLGVQRVVVDHRPQLDKRHLIPKIIRRHIVAQSLLKKVNIYNSFARYIRFPSHKAMFRRSQPYFLIMINTVCFWRQYQKESVMKYNPYTKKDEEWYECDLTDYEVARELFLKSNLLSYVEELPERLIELYEDIREMVKEKAKTNGLSVTETAFIQREVREITHLSNESIKKYLRKLVEYEYIQLTGGKRHGTRFSYRLREDEAINKVNTSEIIPTAEQIKTMIEQEGR